MDMLSIVMLTLTHLGLVLFEFRMAFSHDQML